MNKEELTEEDVIRYLEECNESQDIYGFCYIPEKVCSKILDLYNKEKEEKEKFKEAFIKRMEYSHELEKDLFENASNYVVSKDKIKEKIKELEQDVKDFEEYWSKDPRGFKKEKSVDYYKLEALKELLEEE